MTPQENHNRIVRAFQKAVQKALPKGARIRTDKPPHQDKGDDAEGNMYPTSDPQLQAHIQARYKPYWSWHEKQKKKK